MRTSNPALRAGTFAIPNTTGASMTLGGTVRKTGLLVGITVVVTLMTFAMAARGANVSPWMMAGLVVGLVVGIATPFKPRWAAVTGPIYALAEGLFLGGVSAFYEARYPGIAISAAGCTMGTLAALLLTYQMGFI